MQEDTYFRVVRSVLRKSFKCALGVLFRFNPFFRYTLAKSLTVFVFHEVADTPSEFAKRYGLALSVDQFNKHICWIKSNFNVVSPELVMSGQLPKNAALITFDDGFSGAFQSGFPILEKMRMPAVMFMNMRCQIEKTPLLSAKVLYLAEYSQVFREFLESYGILYAPHLHVTPQIMQDFEDRYGTAHNNVINTYQGDLVDTETMRIWDSSDIVYYGNHLYDHWNAAALSEAELAEQFQLNREALGEYQSSLEFFAFTNGKPDTCFSSADVKKLEALGARKIFSSVKGVNKDVGKLLLGRVSTHATDKSSYDLWCRVGLSHASLR